MGIASACFLWPLVLQGFAPRFLEVLNPDRPHTSAEEIRVHEGHSVFLSVQLQHDPGPQGWEASLHGLEPSYEAAFPVVAFEHNVGIVNEEETAITVEQPARKPRARAEMLTHLS
jgi:hypothetical protein